MSKTNREIIDGLLEDGSSMVGHKKEDLLPFLEYVAQKCGAAGKVDTNTSDLLKGVSAAPIGQQVVHERRHLLMAVDVLDNLDLPVVAKSVEPNIVTENQPTT